MNSLSLGVFISLMGEDCALCDITKSWFELQNLIEQNKWQMDFVLYLVLIDRAGDFYARVYVFIALCLYSSHITGSWLDIFAVCFLLWKINK